MLVLEDTSLDGLVMLVLGDTSSGCLMVLVLKHISSGNLIILILKTISLSGLVMFVLRITSYSSLTISMLKFVSSDDSIILVSRAIFWGGEGGNHIGVKGQLFESLVMLVLRTILSSCSTMLLLKFFSFDGSTTLVLEIIFLNYYLIPPKGGTMQVQPSMLLSSNCSPYA